MTKMSYSAGAAQLQGYRREIAGIRTRMRAAMAQIEPQEVADYPFETLTGKVRLSQLFGHHKDLIVVHNMGRSCPGCTLWGDGFNGIYQHVTNRAGFAVSSPDRPEVQREFAASRGWAFPMVSHMGTDFAADMGYRSSDGKWLPGISVFKRIGDGKIVRVSDAEAGPGDDFCSLWHLFDLIPEGSAGWMPKITYP
ncbi:MAG TPA: DUF899 family protein [Steroidobacteraceae bacterium]|nr:DUF899 family protein [Steroidobacteraceae bacterium]